MSWFFDPNIFYEFYLIRHSLLKAIKRYSGELSGKMMDFGCGSKPYQSLFNVTHYVGVDYQGEGHSHTNEQIDVYYDGKTLPFDDQTFDSIFSTEVFEHIFNLPEILNELNRVLKSDGNMLITCPFNWNLHEEPVDYARYTPYALNYLFRNAGFEVIEQYKSGHFILCIHQMRLLYIYTHIIPHIPFKYLRRLVLSAISMILNLWALFCAFILPKGNSMYFNNVFLVKKSFHKI